jgi:hypothetical protein
MRKWRMSKSWGSAFVATWDAWMRLLLGCRYSLVIIKRGFGCVPPALGNESHGAGGVRHGTSRLSRPGVLWSWDFSDSAAFVCVSNTKFM